MIKKQKIFSLISAMRNYSLLVCFLFPLVLGISGKGGQCSVIHDVPGKQADSLASLIILLLVLGMVLLSLFIRRLTPEK